VVGGRRPAGRRPQIIVDLAGLEFIDSSGVAALVRGRNLARQAGGDLMLAAPRQQVLRVLTLTRLVDVFPVYATVAEEAGPERQKRYPALARQSPRLTASYPRRPVVIPSSRHDPDALDRGGPDLCAPMFAPCLLGCPGTPRQHRSQQRAADTGNRTERQVMAFTSTTRQQFSSGQAD